MKRVTEEVLNDYQPAKKVKVDLDHDHDADVNGWLKVEKKKKRKGNKATTAKQNVAYPRFMYSTQDIQKRSRAISIDELRDLILHLVADTPQQSWLRVENLNLIQRVVVVFVPGLTPDILSLPPLPKTATSNPNLPISIPLASPMPDFENEDDTREISTASCIPFIATTFSHACPTRAPGDQTRMHSVMSSMFTGPVSNEEKNKRVSLKKESEPHNADPTQHLLTLEQMIENDYPVPSYMADIFPKSTGWLETAKPSETESKWNQKIYAIDCEMCTTEDGKELTRICVIDFATGTVLYDQLVKPAKPILDYLTKWSGITAEVLSNVTTTFEEVQAEVMRLLSPPTPELKPNPFVMDAPSSSPSSAPVPPPSATPILIGHSLESDLKALKICHPRCIDTALLYHHPRGRPLKPGLAWLTKKWCGRQIQTRGEGGHDPEEDARACVDLLKLKLEYGPGFGEYRVDFESIFERMARCDARGGDGSGGVGKVRSAVVDHGNPGVMHGAKANTAIGCNTDDEVLEGMLGAIPSHQFTYGRFLGLANALGWITPKASSDAPIIPPPTLDNDPPPSPEELVPVLTALNDHLQKLHRALPPRTAFVIFTGHSDPRKMAILNARRTAFETAYRGGKSVEEMNGEGLSWTTADARDLEDAVEFARRGLLFLGIKQ